jgi:hypothetical protein
VPQLAKRLGGRQTIGAGFVLTTAGFVVVGLTDASWGYLAFLLPLVAIAVGMGLSNGPSSSAATAAVPEAQVGEADGAPDADALAAGLAAASWVMAVISALGILLAVVAIRRHRAATGTLQDSAAAAAAHLITLPTTATGAPTRSGPAPGGP